MVISAAMVISSTSIASVAIPMMGRIVAMAIIWWRAIRPVIIGYRWCIVPWRCVIPRRAVTDHDPWTAPVMPSAMSRRFVAAAGSKDQQEYCTEKKPGFHIFLFCS